MKLLMSIRIQKFNKIHTIKLQDSVKLGDKVKYDVKATKYLVTFTFLFDTTVQTKTSYWLLNIIGDIRRTSTMING